MIFEISEAPSVITKEHVKFKSIEELSRFCDIYELPLLCLSNAQHFIGNIPTSGENKTFDLYFTYMSGLYYVYIDREGSDQ